MAGTRAILAALAIGSAIISLPAAAQSSSSSSLTHTVSVTVPPRVKVQVANLSVSTPGMVRNSVVQAKTDGLSLTIKGSRTWVLTAGSASDVTASKSELQWSSDSSSGFSSVTVPAHGIHRQGKPVVLTVTAP
jgi:hypothetical protein